MNPQNKHKKEALIAKASLERKALHTQWQVVRETTRPAAVRSELVRLGTEKVYRALPDAAGAFSLLQRYPTLSVRLAKTLLAVATSSNRYVKPVALGLASWYIYKRFKSPPPKDS